MKTRKSYTAPDMKVMPVATEQILADSLAAGKANYGGDYDIEVSNDESSAAGAAKHTSVWEDE